MPSSDITIKDIESDYRRIIAGCMHRMHVPLDSVEIEVHRTGLGVSGLEAFAGFVRLLRWDPARSPLMLQNLLLIDARIRKAVAATPLLEYTEFTGIWFQTCAPVAATDEAFGESNPAELAAEPAARGSRN